MTIQENVPLAPLTTFKIGGPAKYFAEVKTLEELKEAFVFAREHCLSFYVLSGGSNVLFSDQGFNGLVIKLENNKSTFTGNRAYVEAGVNLFAFIREAVGRGLSGMERMAGVPGAVGGAIRGNAGAFGTEIKSVVHMVTALHRQTLDTKVFSQDECRFTYRHSFFKDHPEWIIFLAELVFQIGEREALERIVQETVVAREAKHSQDAQCAGSFFMNPVVRDENLRQAFEKDTGLIPRNDRLPAGWLIDEAGLRGYRIGHAQVSPKHPNYILNTGGATAEEIIMLASLVKQRIRTQFNIQLREEVQLVGFW